jgi:hypothetical protein
MTDAEVESTFNTIFHDFIKHDIQAAIEGRANYLAALGIFSYVEFLGGLLSGHSGIINKAKGNFNEAIRHFPPEYQKLNDELKVVDAEGLTHEGIYGIIRCGLVHEYMVKGGGTVYNNPTGPIANHTGITYEFIGDKKVIAIYNNEFFRDFRTVIDTVSEFVKNKEQPYYDNIKKSFSRLASRTPVEISPSPSASPSASPSPSQEDE